MNGELPTYRRMRTLISVLALIIPVAAAAASFDCGKARTPSEKLICSTPELSALDDKAAAAYRTALASAASNSPVPKAEIRKDQAAWLKLVLANCKDALQMRDAYADHIATLEFEVHPTPLDPSSKFTIVHYVRDEYSKFTQIRSTPPHPVIERLNHWLRSTVASHPSATYYYDDTEIIAGRVASSFLGTEDYFQGAAHGAPARHANTLDLATGKEVDLKSLFRPGINYGARLKILVDEDLRTKWKHGEWQYEEQQVAAALEGDSFPFFSLISGALVLHYPPYVMGPYSSGDADIVIPYSKIADLADPKGLLAIVGKEPLTRKQVWEK